MRERRAMLLYFWALMAYLSKGDNIGAFPVFRGGDGVPAGKGDPVTSRHHCVATMLEEGRTDRNRRMCF
eukprot:355400-Chlamydomonas_euryale.AAC.1